LVVGLFVVGGDEISIAPCPFVDRNQVVKFNLKVDDQEMMKNKRDFKSGWLAFSSCRCVVSLCLFVCCGYVPHVKAP
jgi:hypothetical protein